MENVVVKKMKVLAASPRENDATQQQKQQVNNNSNRRDSGAAGGNGNVTSCNYCIGVSVYTKCVKLITIPTSCGTNKLQVLIC